MPTTSKWIINPENLSIIFSSKKFTHTYWAIDKEDFDKKVKEIKK